MEIPVNEVLILLCEEASEVIKAATKCIRFGYYNKHSTYGSNRDLLASEIGDLLGCIDSLSFSKEGRESLITRRNLKMEKYSFYRKDTDKENTKYKDWLPMETAPKDIPIIVLHDDSQAPTFDNEETETLTTYMAHAEGFGRIKERTVFQAIWGGEYSEGGGLDDLYPSSTIPDWWFVDDGEFDKPIYPIAWMPIPTLED